MKTIRSIATELLANSVVEGACLLKVKEHPHLHRPAWDVWAKPAGTARGRHLFSVIAHEADMAPKMEKCPDCNGDGLVTTHDQVDEVIGLVPQQHVCRRCTGIGWIDPQHDIGSQL